MILDNKRKIKGKNQQKKRKKMNLDRSEKI